MPTIPLIYLAFANANDSNKPLPGLEREGRKLYQLLLPRKQQRHFDLHRDEFAYIQDIAKNLRTFKDQVVIFHYGGHAGSKALFLKDQEAHAAGIAELLSQQKHLKLVFLNGCSTQEQVDYLLELGVPAVIATACPINDSLATEFAEQLYDALVKDHTLKEAYDHAAAYLKSKDQPVACLRGIQLDRQVGAQTWILRVADEAQYGWKLPQEVHPDPGGKLPHILTDSPIPPEIFLGREDDLQRIHDKLFAPGGNLLLLVNGEGGVGKTSLAARYYHTYKDGYAHVAWVTSNRNLVDAVLTLDRPLGLWQDEGYRQLDTPHKLEALLTALSNLPKPSLLVIDNANELDDLKAYYPQLQRCSNFHILFTTRISEYSAADFFKIEPLPEDIALQAFKTHYKAFEAAEEPLFRELYRTIGGNTLVLELFAKNLNHFNNRLKKRYLLADLKRDVEQGLLRLSQSAPVPTRYQGLRQATPEEIISAMYDISDLPKEEIALLAAFAALPAERIAFETLDTLLNQDNLDTHLLHLAQKGWLDYSEEDAAFKCSPVVQEALRRQHGDWEADCGKLIDVLTQKLNINNNHVGNFDEIIKYSQYAENLINRILKPDFFVAILSHYLGNFLTSIGNFAGALKAHYKTLEHVDHFHLAAPNFAMFREMQAVAFERIGHAFFLEGRLSSALDCFRKQLKLNKELYEKFPLKKEFKDGLAQAHQFLGNTYLTMGDSHNTLFHRKRFNEIMLELYFEHPDDLGIQNGLAISYQSLGIFFQLKEDYRRALQNYKKDLILTQRLEKLHPDNYDFQVGMAISCSKLGEVFRETGDFERALHHFEKFYQMMTMIQRSSPRIISYQSNLAIACHFLGHIYNKIGDLNKAFDFFQQQLDVATKIFEFDPKNIEFKSRLAIAHHGLGTIHFRFNQDEVAKEHLEIYHKMSQELFETFSEHIDIVANYAEGLAIIWAIRNLSNDDREDFSLQEANQLWNSLHKKTGRPFYKRKAALCEKMQQADTDLRELIVEMASF